MPTPTVWPRRPCPQLDPDARVLGRWRPASLAELTAHRHQLSAALHDGASPPARAEDAVEALILVFEELVSNAVRHGRAPVTAQITTDTDGWLIDVSDAAVDRLPRLDLGRDPPAAVAVEAVRRPYFPRRRRWMPSSPATRISRATRLRFQVCPRSRSSAVSRPAP